MTTVLPDGVQFVALYFKYSVSNLDHMKFPFGFVLAVAFAVAGVGGIHAQSNYATPYTFGSLAGPVPSAADGADGIGVAARFNNPNGVAVDASGNVYVADTVNHTIRKITAAGVVTTFAGTVGLQGSADGTGSAARFNNPNGVAVDGSGNVYVGDTGNNTIRKITAGGDVTTLAGVSGYGGMWSDGTGSAARFNGPWGIAIDTSGNVYVADAYNCMIRKITSEGVVTTLAGEGHADWEDGIGRAARFAWPHGVAVDGNGNVYVADTNTQTIRKITSTGVVTTIAGKAGEYGSVDGTGSAARFNGPCGIAVDTRGNVYVVDMYNCMIRKITSEGVVTTLAGSANDWGALDGIGSDALFRRPTAAAVDVIGNVYVADTDNGTIRKVTSGGVVSTLAGTAPTDLLYNIPRDGAGSAARFGMVRGITVDASGSIYIADNNSLRKITTAGVVTALGGQRFDVGSTDGPINEALFSSAVYGVAVDGSGNLYIADTNNYTIRKISAAGMVTTLAGTAGLEGSTDGIGSAARFNRPYGLAVGGDGTLYVADQDTVRKVTADGVVTTLAGMAGSFGSTDGTGSEATFGFVSSVAVDGNGNVYALDRSYGRIRKITEGGVVTTLAGAGGEGSLDGSGGIAHFKYPWSIAVDGSGNVYVADTENETIRKVTSDGVVTTLAGATGGIGANVGTGIASRFNTPWGIAVTSSGQVVVADTNNYRILTAAPYLTNNATASGTAGVSFKFTITANGLMGTYGATGLPSGLSVDASTGEISGIPMVAGTFEVTLSATNVYGQTGTGTLSLTVATGNQSISFGPLANKIYGDAPFALGATASSNLAPTYTVVSGPATVSGSTLTLTGTGTVVVRASQSGNGSFFAATDVDASFSVVAATVKLGSLSAIYDGAPKGATATTIPAGLNVTFAYNGSENPPKDAGSYTVVGTISDGNYTGTARGTLVITKATLTATVDQVAFSGQPSIALVVNYTGFGAGDDASAVNRDPKATTSVTSSSGPGLYSVTLSGGADDNYNFILVPGQLRLVSYAGTYDAMLMAGESGPLIGKLELKMGLGSAYTGTLWLGGEPAPLVLKGSFAFTSSVVTATSSILLKGYTITLSLPENGALQATVKSGATLVATSEIGAKLWTPARGKAVSWAGAYTLLLRDASPVDTGDTAAYPHGDGYASAKISSTGVMTLSGALSDGTKLTATLNPDDGTTPGYRLFVQPYGQRAGSYVAARFILQTHPSLAGFAYLPASAGQDVYWAKDKGAGDAGYRAGFGPLGLTLTLDPWLVPNGTTTLGGRLVLGSGNVFEVNYQGAARVQDEGALPASLVLADGTKPQAPEPNPLSWSLKITPATGVFSGSFVLGDQLLVKGKTVTVKRTVPFAGALRQAPDSSDSVIGAGAFMLPALPTDPTREKLSGEILFTRPGE